MAVTWVTENCYSELLAQLGGGCVIDVNLGEDPASSCIGFLLDEGLEHLTGATPGGPEVQNDDLRFVKQVV